MQSNILTTILIACNVTLAVLQAQSQPSEPRFTRQDYIEKFAEHAVAEMHNTGIPASITLAQGMLESDYGNSPLAKYAKNHFGIKCHKGWEGPSFIQDDDEANECFRKYYSEYDSYRDHSAFLMTRDRYAFLFDLKPTDYKGWAHGLKQAGYATNPRYADMLIKIIEENSLHQYDKFEKIPEPKVIAKVERERPENTTPKVLAVRQIEVSDNNIKFVKALNGDTPEAIASRNEMGLWQIMKYNDFAENKPLLAGEVVYLQPKRNSANAEYHAVSPGESLHQISQKYGVKLKRLEKLNDLQSGENPNTGTRIALRK
ncbi:MAG: glucosaminidase domain-containing protein [Salibacteraceae bacterium]|jgi:LysM repeat protein|nr:glucosaminidase domain-containing protein [Salibacteraceae bacterium]MDP4687905.1 glucosaminidase domain-containing protein [Salibacteraceae bacterium]MDP4764272.1 glucosaminidase domain-containing protein [Salibacteraceae bacterium]MDP4842985.1 glucosaminidase domain-containing protein [Salibacteraceae bacterium]MDP4933326.1 glucosaminidase domain-containing protein [Salibacteraceae bacterium]